MNLPLVVFDLDGTLVNSLPPTFQAMDEALSGFLGRALEISDLRVHFGHTDVEIIELVAGVSNNEKALQQYLDSLEEKAAEIKVFCGLEDIIRNIKNPTAIVTNRARVTTDIICRKTGLDRLFEVVVAADDGPEPKPSAEGIIHAAKQLNTNPKGGIMIGDGPDDIKSGRAAQMTTIAARWCPLIPIEQLQKQNPDIWMEKVEDLREHLVYINSIE